MKFVWSLILLIGSSAFGQVSKSDFDVLSKPKQVITQVVQSPVSIPKYSPSRPYIDPPGYHRHIDSKGNVWTHKDSKSNINNVEAHTSPFTQEVHWNKYNGWKPPTPIKNK